MKAYQIFLFLFLFGLIAASMDEMGIMSRHQIGHIGFNEDIGIAEISEVQDIQSEETFLTYVPKMLISGTKILGSALINMICIIPLFQKYGVPIEVTLLFQTVLTLITFIALFYIITGRSLKHGE